jgi:hypothetical protein
MTIPQDGRKGRRTYYRLFGRKYKEQESGFRILESGKSRAVSDVTES